MALSIFPLIVLLALVLAAFRGPSWMKLTATIVLALAVAFAGFFVVATVIFNAIQEDSVLPPLGGAAAAIAAGAGSFFLIRRWTRPRVPGAAPSQHSSPQPHASAPSRAMDVFISYKRDERALVHAIAERLKALKLSVWFDAEIHSGKTFDAEIDRHVRSAKCVLVCWSPGAVASDWVRGEATIGRQRNVLAATMLVPCDLPAPFNLVHANDLTMGIGPGNGEWLQTLERIAALVGRPGLAAFERLEISGPAAFGEWIARNAGDPLLEEAVRRLKALPV